LNSLLKNYAVLFTARLYKLLRKRLIDLRAESGDNYYVFAREWLKNDSRKCSKKLTIKTKLIPSWIAPRNFQLITAGREAFGCWSKFISPSRLISISNAIKFSLFVVRHHSCNCETIAISRSTERNNDWLFVRIRLWESYDFQSGIGNKRRVKCCSLAEKFLPWNLIETIEDGRFMHYWCAVARA